MTNSSQQVIAVIGAGIMGRGIVQLFAQSGYQVKFFDNSAAAVTAANNFVTDMFNNKAAKGRISQQQADAAIGNLHPCNELGAIADCEIVVEAIIEDLQIKQNLFAELEAIVSPSTILASNTSSLLVADIAAKCQHPERVAGLHFFNPVPVMKVVEIISSVKTSEDTASQLKDCINPTGHRAVQALDQPGFLINHAGRGLYTEGLRILEEQAASHVQIDRLIREAADFKMGPFELLDLTGLDVSAKVMQSIYEQFQGEPRFRPSSLVPPRVSAGLYGRKSAAGWYQYEGNQKLEPDEYKPQPCSVENCKVWIDPAAKHADGLATLIEQAGAQVVQSHKDASLLLIQPWGIDATQACADLGIDASRCVAIDPLPDLAKRRTLMLTPVTSPQARDQAAAILSADNIAISIINDSPGFVCQRILAMIVNIAADIAQRGIASPTDIDDAVRIGLGYPKGPLTLGDSIGSENILHILAGLQRVTGDPRYRPSHWLRRRVQLGQSLLTPASNRQKG